MNNINLNSPNNWSVRMAGYIAKQFGYVLNNSFVDAIKEYRIKAREARVTDFLSVLGEKHLKDHVPALDRRINK